MKNDKCIEEGKSTAMALIPFDGVVLNEMCAEEKIIAKAKT